MSLKHIESTQNARYESRIQIQIPPLSFPSIHPSPNTPGSLDASDKNCFPFALNPSANVRNLFFSREHEILYLNDEALALKFDPDEVEIR